MGGEWPIKTIAECASDEPYSTQIGPFGKALTPEEYTESGVPLLRGVNVNHGRFHDDDYVFISEETADRLGKFESFPGDVLLVHKGTLGKIGLMPKERQFRRYIMGNSMLRVRCNPRILMPEYLYYWLSSADGTNYLLSRVSQVGVPQIQQPLTTLRQARLPVPTLPEQRAITAILGSLDDKIECNRRMNRTLEAIARAVFRSWFVDFDPVRARADGRTPAGMDAATAALFPDRFEDSGLGRIPAGWKVTTWRDVVALEYGKSLRTYDQANGEYPVYGTNGRIGWHIEPLCKEPGIVVGRKGAYRGVHFSDRPFFVIDTAFFVRPLLPLEPRWAYYEMLNLDINSMDSGSAIPSTSRDEFAALPVLVPPIEIQRRFATTLGPCWQRQSANDRESCTLATLRDALLPKLISGELRIPDAERLVGSVP